MADYQIGSTNDYVNYLEAGSMEQAKAFFRDGGKLGDGTSFPKVDMSLWDQATMCGTCHVGGVFYEQDRMGTRLPQRTRQDWGFVDGTYKLNPITATVWENYSSTGEDKSFVTMSPWIYPVYQGRGGAPDPAYQDGNPMMAPFGWGPADMQMPNPNGGTNTIKRGQLMMPNVKEMDCLFCHLKGYDNVMASVMVQAGSLSAVPTTGAGLFDMFSLSPTFMGYDPKTGKTAFTPLKAAFGQANLDAMGFSSYSSHEVVTLTENFTVNIKGKPDDNNCHQCHATKTLKDFPEMFGVTGNSSGFLSSAPMVFDPAYGYGPTGKRMVNYDINAPFLYPNQTSPVITSENYMNYMMSGLTYLQANGPSPFNSLQAGELGGGNMGMTGPLYYYTMDGKADQNILKKSTMPFPRAEWFKRGDAWQAGQDVHSTFGCAGCHFTGDSTNKNQCDPARGFDMASTIQDGLPAFKNRLPVLTGDDSIKKHDTRNTVKRCEFCHVTGTDYNGNPIDTFGAPNANGAHQAAGLLANLTQVVDKYTLHGEWGGKGVPREANFTSNDSETRDGVGPTSHALTSTPGGTILAKGNHLDVMDCTVCHVNKVSMAVRSLDASSGMRFPAIVGTDREKGMMGLFEDPTGYGQSVMGGALKQWKPLHLWQALGNQQLPLSTDNKPADPRFQFRRKLYLTNAITAILWNNEGGSVDANGDGVPGGILNNSKPSLVGYKDIFTGDDLDENNTAGFDIPIFDPWIQKDLKAGFNFGPAPLSVISVGFGGGDYRSLYNPMTGMFDNDNWKYASVWSGAVVFTEPDQIAAYKAFRTSTAPADKSWENTRLTFVGAPFMVTHGVKSTETYVRGKNCTDCHAADQEFFKGGFDMIGPALPSVKQYDTNSYPKTDKFGNVVLDVNGNPVHQDGYNPATPSYNPMDAGNMMMRPLEPVRVKANKNDIRAYLETHNKLGQPREVSFVKDTADGYAVASTVDRSEAMYPPEDGAIYYAAGQVNADGSINGGAQPMTGPAYADYLEGLMTDLSGNPKTAADFGIGIDPVATINPIADVSATELGVQVKQNTDVALSAAAAQMKAGSEVGSATYAWTTSDGTVVTGASSRTGATVKFTTLGTKTITLRVTDEEGKVSQTSTNVDVILPPIAITWDPVADTAKFQTFPAGTTSVKITWGDGLSTTRSGTYLTDPLSVKHVYSTQTAKTIKFYCYNASGVQVGYQQISIMP